MPGHRRLTAISTRLDREMAIVDRADRPADDKPGIQIQDDRQVGLPVLANAQLAGVTDPALIRSISRVAAR
jgi:hypothetical protein